MPYNIHLWICDWFDTESLFSPSLFQFFTSNFLALINDMIMYSNNQIYHYVHIALLKYCNSKPQQDSGRSVGNWDVTLISYEYRLAPTVERNIISILILYVYERLLSLSEVKSMSKRAHNLMRATKRITTRIEAIWVKGKEGKIWGTRVYWGAGRRGTTSPPGLSMRWE